MSIIRKARLYFWPPQKKWHPIPKQTISPYEWHDGYSEEALIMLAGRARSPMEARRLMELNRVKTARELLALMPRPPRRTFMARLRAMLLRIDGGGSKRSLYVHRRSEVPITIKLRRDDK